MLRKTIQVTSVALVLSLVLSGCANNPELRDGEKLTMSNVDEVVKKKAAELNQIWSQNDPAITFFEREDGLYVEQLYAVPESILERQMSQFTLLPGGTVSDLSGMLYPYKVNIMFDEGGQGELGSLPFSIRKYSGSMGDLLKMIENLHDVSFEYIGGNTLKVTKETKYIASLPQVDMVLESVSENIAALGAGDIKTNTLAGSIVYTATHREQRDIDSFVQRFYENYAGVKFQITVFNVSLNETMSDGFDWSSLDVVLGSVEAAYAGGYIEQFIRGLSGNNQQNGANGANDANGGANGGTNGGNNNNNNNQNGDNNNNNNNNNSESDPTINYRSRYAGSSIDDIRSFGWLKDDTFELGAFNNNIGVSVAMQWMNQYGNTRAEQSAFIETITGKETIIASQRKVPVISDESTTLVGNLSPVATQNTSTENEEVGIKIQFTPYYDASSQEMIIELNVNLKNIVGIESLTTSTGNTIQRPEIQEEQFPTTVRMKVGDTRLLGGVIFDTIIEDRSDINFIKMSDEYIRKNMQKSAMFIMIRPSVQLFKQRTEVMGNE